MISLKNTLSLKYEIVKTHEEYPIGGVNRLILQQDWDDRFIKIIKEHKIESIVMTYTKLANGIEFFEKLKSFPIRGISIQLATVKDIRPLIHLKDTLECLVLELAFTDAPDFTKFTKLWCVALDWRSKAKTILKSKTITRMGLEKHPFETMEVFSSMPQLEILSLGYGKLESLKGIEKLPKLNELSIFLCRTFESLEGIQNAPNLTKEKVVISKCRQITPNSPFAEYVTFDDLV